MTNEHRASAEAWMAGDPDPTTRAELASILARGDDAELAERFGRSLEFGTAGLRGVLGAGPNRMNRAVVLVTSLGVARHLAREVPRAAERGVVVGYDARRMSRAFAEDTAGVFAAAGLRVHWFDDVVPTPLVAFAVVRLGAAAGVVITASHNPAPYNGYKLYWSNGVQIVPPHDEAIAHEIAAAPAASAVPREPIDAARVSGRLVTLSDDVVQAYVDGVRELAHSVRRPAPPRAAPRSPLSIVYTPLHGVGYPVFDRAMTATGFTEVEAVAEQRAPDPSFPTAPFPNPEEKGVLDLALDLARRRGAELVLANDPDADRLAVAVRRDGDMVPLSGNQVGVLLGHYLLTEGGPKNDRAVISTIVSSPMLGAVARKLGVRYEETLTGFKWIATRALELEAEGQHAVFGYEEALGYAAFDLVYDKDGISAGVLFAGLAALCQERWTTVWGRLSDLYREFGYYASRPISVTLPGNEGAARITRWMSELRARPPERIADRAVLERRDYALGRRFVPGAPPANMALPRSDVLAFELEGETRVVVRPSGTEAKLKVYLDHRENVGPAEPLAAAEERAVAELEAVELAIRSLLPSPLP